MLFTDKRAILTFALSLVLLESARRYPPEAKAAWVWGALGVGIALIPLFKPLWERWVALIGRLGQTPGRWLLLCLLLPGGLLALETFRDNSTLADRLDFYASPLGWLAALIFCGLVLIANPDLLYPTPATEENTTSLPNWVYGLGIVLGSLCFLGFMLALGDRLTDDAFITYRYSRNLVDGYGLRWNPTDADPFEAYTSLLHLLYSAGAIALSLDPAIATQLMGVICSIGILAIFARYSYQHQLHWAVYGSISLLFAINPLFAIHNLSGMETPLFIFFLTLGTYFFFQSLENEHYLPHLFITIVLGVFTRPDAGLLFGLYYLMVTGYKLNRANLGRWASLSLVILGIPGAGYILFKALYFGSVLPNSYGFKVGGYYEALPGKGYVLDFFGALMPLPLLLLIASFYWKKIKQAELFAAFAILISMLFYLTLRPKIGFGYRFLIPFLPSLVLILALPLHRLLAQFNYHKGLSGIMLVGIIGQVTFATRTTWDEMLKGYPYIRSDVVMAKCLEGIPDPQRFVLVTGQAGVLPYYSDFYHLDFNGLTSPQGAEFPFDPSWVFDYPIAILMTHTIATEQLPDGSFVFDPEVLAYHLETEQNSTEFLSYKILADPRFQNFELLAKMPYIDDPQPPQYNYVFVNRDFEYFDLLKQRFAALPAITPESPLEC